MVNYFTEGPAARSTGDRFRFRIRRWQAAVLTTSMAALAFASLAVGVLLVAAHAWVGLPIAVAAFAGTIYLAVRLPRLSISADVNGVVVRSIRRTYRLRWDEILEFRGAGPDPTATAVPRVILTNGGWVKIVAAARSAWEPRTKFDYVAAELNGFMRRVKSGELPA